MTKWFCFLVLIGLLIACDNSKYADKYVVRFLDERYKERFEVTENYYSPKMARYDFLANPIDQPEITVHGDYEQKLERIFDNYPHQLLTYRVQKNASAFLNQYYPCFVIKTTATSGYKHKGGSKVKELDGFLGDSTFQSKLTFHIYLPDTVTVANKEEMLKGMVAYMHELSKYKNNVYVFNVDFWDKSFLMGEATGKQGFGFNLTNKAYVHDPVIDQLYISQQLWIRFSSQQARSITIDNLYSYIAPYENSKSYPDKLHFEEEGGGGN